MGLYQVGSKNTLVSCCWLWFFKLAISTSPIKMGVFEAFPTILTLHDTVTILRHQNKKILLANLWISLVEFHMLPFILELSRKSSIHSTEAYVCPLDSCVIVKMALKFNKTAQWGSNLHFALWLGMKREFQVPLNLPSEFAYHKLIELFAFVWFHDLIPFLFL